MSIQPAEQPHVKISLETIYSKVVEIERKVNHLWFIAAIIGTVAGGVVIPLINATLGAR